MGKIAPPGSFDSAPSSAMSRDESVTRSARDDGFVGVLKKNIPNKLALMGLRPGLSSAVATGLDFVIVVVTHAPNTPLHRSVDVRVKTSPASRWALNRDVPTVKTL
jgi:hypothetical protein